METNCKAIVEIIEHRENVETLRVFEKGQWKRIIKNIEHTEKRRFSRITSVRTMNNREKSN